MTEDKPNNNVSISVEQICAAIIGKLGKVELSVEELLKDYSSMGVMIDQDPETQVLTFSLAESPVEEVQTENE